MLKIGNDHFEATHLEPKVEVCNRRYVFDAQPHFSMSDWQWARSSAWYFA
jgi:murein L,D-transpeptidase YafK